SASVFVRRENRRGGPELCPHVANRLTVRRRQAPDSWTVIFDYLTDATLHVITPEHLEDNVLCADPFLEFSGELNSKDFGTGQMIRMSGHGQSNIEATGANPENRYAGRSRSMAIGADQGLSRDSEPFHVNLVGNAVPWRAEMDSIPGRSALKVDVIVGILAVCLDDVVIHVLDGKISLYRTHPQGLEFQHGHGPCGVLKEYLVDSDADFLTRNQSSFNQVSFEYLLGQILSHYFLLF